MKRVLIFFISILIALVSFDYNVFANPSNFKSYNIKNVFGIYKIDYGKDFALILLDNGDLYSFGKNDKGQLGTGDNVDYPVPKKIMENIQKISCGVDYSLVLSNDNKLYSFGANDLYQLGTGDNLPQNKPVQIMYDVADCYAGLGHNYVLTIYGSLFGFGNNLYQQIKNSSIPEYRRPELIKTKQSQILPKYYPDIPRNLEEVKLDDLELIKQLESEILNYRLTKDDKLIAFTFDDGPSDYTSGLLDELNKYKARGTFFVLGQRAAYRPDLLQRMENEGHEIGNHSYNHPKLTNYSSTQILNEIDSCDNAILAATNLKPHLFRPPYGAYNSKVLSLLKSRNKSAVLWNVDTLDWKYRDANYVKNYILDHSNDGDIVLLHDIHKSSVDGFKAALPELINRGFKLVTVSELIELRDHREDGAVYFRCLNQ